MSQAGGVPPLSQGGFNVTSKGLSKALKAAGAAGLFLGYSSPTCTYCAVHEEHYSAYDALAATHRGQLPRLARVNADRERTLVARHEIADLPALVLAHGGRWTRYAGPHTRAAMAAFGAAQRAPASQPVRGEAEKFGARLDVVNSPSLSFFTLYIEAAI